MNIIKSFFDTQRKHFVDGGKLEKLYPFFESMETVFFASDEVAQEVPHVRDNLDIKRYLMLVVLMLVPALLFGIYNAGYQSRFASGLSLDFIAVFLAGAWIVMPIVIVSYVVGFFWEIIFAVKRKHKISEGLFVTAMLFPLTLPPTTPLWQVALGISFGIIIGKEIFGGTGRNFLNPALTGRAFLFFAYPAQMSGDAVWIVLKGVPESVVDTVSGATPLAIAALTETAATVEGALSEAGYGFSRMFFGLYPDSIGASSTLICMVGAAILMILGIASYRIILGDILGILCMGFLLNLIAAETSLPYLSLNPFYHLVMGGAAFGIAFMTTDPVSAPDLNTAKWIYGFAIGALTVIIRVFNPAFPEGMMLAILFMNLFAPLLDHMLLGFRLRKRIPNV
ncbi:NADH:ubiquinone reductase (Na(+)-transporting) subunit B [Thermodesulfobacteriota bacterium]